MGVTTPTIPFWRAPRMRLHRNAKTSPRMRQLIIERVRHQRWTQARAAEAAGVSVRTVAKWLARQRAGDTQLDDASSRPHRQPRCVAPDRAAAIVQLRRTRATAWQISAALQMPRSTVAVVLRRVGLIGCRRSSRPALSSAMNGRTRATCCTSISSRSAGFAALGIASRGIGSGRSRGAAGSMSMSPLMTRRGSRMSKCDSRSDGTRVAAFCVVRSSGLRAEASECSAS